MPSNEQLLYLNAILFCGIAISGIVLVLKARKSMAGADGRYIILTTAGRLCPAIGCVAAGFVFLQSDLVHAVALLAAFSLVGVSLSLFGHRFIDTNR